jgi:Cdc6-like AAA superfamily ATPase
MRDINISAIENAFLPAKEIDTVERFAGREKQVTGSYLALHAIGSNIAIIGNRGIGKTSLARQIINIASGNNDLLKKLGIPLEGKLDYLTMYFACGGALKTFPDLLLRLLTTNDCLLDWIYEIPSAKKEIRKLDPKLNVALASIGGTWGNERETQSAITVHAIDTVFTNVVSAIMKQKIAKNGILVVVDEFDRIEDPSGFADFLKALSTNVPGVKFCLVGVAQDIQFLMKEHDSSYRLFADGIVNMPPMVKMN